MSRTVLLLAAIVSSLVSCKSAMEPFIVGGEPAPIEYFAHSAFLSLRSYYDIAVCGSSILNQNVLISAAHCFEDLDKKSQVTVKAGNSNKMQGSVRYATKVFVHEEYDPVDICNDIALVYVKQPFVLGPNIKRVVLLRKPPESKFASVAGWGLINERTYATTNWLQQTEQQLLSWSDCNNVLKKLPIGTICGGAEHASNYASQGDSGSALVVNEFIQIGLVSFKRPHISRSIVVYTDVAYFYDWVMNTSKNLHCPSK